MTTKVELFDTNAIPFGALSNNAITPFYKDGKLWKSATHYVYANLLRGTYQNLIMNCPLKDIRSDFDKYKDESLSSLTTNILENGVRTLVAQNTQFRDMLLQTGNKRLIYVTNSTLFGQSEPILGTTRDGEGLNLLGKIYETIRAEEKTKLTLKKDSEKTRERDEQIIKIIFLTKILQSEMLTKFNDLGELSDKTFDSLYDQFQYDIDGLTHLDKVLLDQYRYGRLVNNKLIQQAEQDPDNIIYYVRNYYKDQFKLKLYYTRRRALVDFFLKEQLKGRHPSEFDDNELALDHELDGQLNAIYKKGADFTKNLFDNISKLYDDGKLKIPEEVTAKYDTNIDDQLAKKETNGEHLGAYLSDDQVDGGESSQSTAGQPELPIIPVGDQNSELTVLRQMNTADELQLSQLHPDPTVAGEDIEHQETINYIIFTDKPGPYQILSPYHADRFSDGYQYPNLISYYYVKLIYSLGNIVQRKQDIIMLPGATQDTKLLVSMTKAHRFIMIPECHNINTHCDQFDMKNYITDFSELPAMILELENRNKVTLLEEALTAKFDRNHNLQVLLTQNPSKPLEFLYAESSLPEHRYDEIIGIGPDAKGKNYTGKILSKLRSNYLDEQQATDRLNNDIAFLSHLFQNDAQLIGWFYSRGTDILNTMLLVFISTKHIPNAGDKYEIKGEFIQNVLHYLYDACDVSFDQFIELEVPEQFFIRINDEFEQKFRSYTNTSNAVEIPVTLSSNAIVEIWKYCTWLMYQLLLESSRYKQKNNIKLFLTNIVLNMTENDSQCAIRINPDDNILRNVKTCIISAIINAIKALIIIYFNKQPFNIMMCRSIANIIIGKPVQIKEPSDQSNIFENILPKYPVLLHYIQQSNTPEQVTQIISQLNIIYDYLERQSSDSFDVTQLENQRTRNRINFFSSIPTRHPQSMVAESNSSSSSIDSDGDGAGDDLLAQLKIQADLGPIDINAKQINSTQLKPAGRGFARFKRPPGGHPIPSYKEPQYSNTSHAALIGSGDQQRLMQDLINEFGDDHDIIDGGYDDDDEDDAAYGNYGGGDGDDEGEQRDEPTHNNFLI